MDFGQTSRICIKTSVRRHFVVAVERLWDENDIADTEGSGKRNIQQAVPKQKAAAGTSAREEGAPLLPSLQGASASKPRSAFGVPLGLVPRLLWMAVPGCFVTTLIFYGFMCVGKLMLNPFDPQAPHPTTDLPQPILPGPRRG